MRLCNPGRPGTQYVAQIDVELRELLPRLHVPAPTPGSCFSSNFQFLLTSDIEYLEVIYLDVVRVFFLSVLRHYQPRFVCSLPSSHLSLLSIVASQAVCGAEFSAVVLASHSGVWAEQYSAIRVDLQTNKENGLRV